MQVRFKLFLHQLKQDRHEEELRAHKQCAYKHVSITSYQMLPNTGSALGKKKPNKPTHKLTVSIIPCEISLFFLFLDKKKSRRLKTSQSYQGKKITVVITVLLTRYLSSSRAFCPLYVY